MSKNLKNNIRILKFDISGIRYKGIGYKVRMAGWQDGRIQDKVGSPANWYCPTATSHSRLLKKGILCSLKVESID